MNIFEYIELAKTKSETKSYNKLAIKIGITGAGLSAIRNGGTASELTLIKIAELAEVDPLDVVKSYKIERCQDEKTRKFWQDIGGSLAASFLFLSLVSTETTKEIDYHLDTPASEKSTKLQLSRIELDILNNSKKSNYLIDNVYIMRSS